MWRACILAAAFSTYALAAVQESLPGVTASNLSTTTAQADNDPPQPPPPCPPITIAKGDQSGWQHDNPDFSGAEFVIRDPLAWGAFWAAHRNPADQPPPIDFMQHVVIVAVQGLQPTGGRPNISIVEVRPAGPFAEVVIVDDKRPGPLAVVTNPFHIVAVCRESLPPHRSVTFLHLRPIPESGTVVGRVFAAQTEGEPTPLGNAHVVLLRPEEPPRDAMTGGDGSYFFVNVPPGEYVLRAEHTDFEPAEVPVAVPPNAIVGHDFVLERSSPPGGAFVGRVLGALNNGQQVPIAGAQVRLMNPDGQAIQTRTDQRGRFAIPDVPAGPYHAVAQAPRWLPAAADVQILAGEVLAHDFVLERPTATTAE